MSLDGNNVRKLEVVHMSDDKGKENTDQQGTPATDMSSTNRDMSKVAVIVSLLAVVLLVIFFFGMNRNIAGLTTEVKSLGALRQDVSDLDQRMGQMQKDLPGQMKRMIALDMVNEMAMKAAFLGNKLEDEGLRNDMQNILQSLKEVRLKLDK